jgi:hypothetical protein
MVNIVFDLPRQFALSHRLNEEHQWHDKNRRIEYVGLFVTLAETLELRIPGFQHDLLVEFVASRKPFVALWARK